MTDHTSERDRVGLGSTVTNGHWIGRVIGAEGHWRWVMPEIGCHDPATGKPRTLIENGPLTFDDKALASMKEAG